MTSMSPPVRALRPVAAVPARATGRGAPGSGAHSPSVLHFWVLLYIAVLYVRPGEIFPSVANLPILDVLSAVGALSAGISLILAPRSFLNEPQDQYFLAFLFAIVVSNPLNGWFGGGMPALTNFAPVLFCYFLLRLSVVNEIQLRRMIRLFVALNLFLATNGLLQVFTGAGFGQVEAMDTREGIRIQGTGIFNDPNDLGMTLVMTVPFVLGSLLGAGTRFVVRVASAVVLGALLMACYYTNSRGTMLGLGAVFAAYVYRRFGVATATACAAVGLVGLLALGPSRMSNVTAEEASAQGRIQAWSAGLQMFKESPLWGVGYRRFGDIHGLVAHNAWVHVLGELGILGALPFTGLFYSFFRVLGRRPRDGVLAPSRLRMRNELADSAIGLMTCMMFLSRQYVVVPFILIAWGASYASFTGPQPDPPRGMLHFVLVGCLTLALVVMFYILVLVLANF